MSLLLRIFVLWAALLGQAVLAGPPPRPRESVEDVRFLLWTRINPGDEEYYDIVLDDSTSLAASPYNKDDPTIVLLHGWTDHGHCCYWGTTAKTELLQLGAYNVISVDWETLAAPIVYPLAVANVPLVGAHTARFLEWVQAEAGLNVPGLQVVGHSLGAHVAAFIGQELTQFRLPFITGLDPAGPEYNNVGPERRLDHTDADFVQVIHTDGCPFVDFNNSRTTVDFPEDCIGLYDEIGDVDFFPNGGNDQPGCYPAASHSGDTGVMGPAVKGCSHQRAPPLWVESISGQSPYFKSYPCEDWPTFEAGKCTTCGQGCLDMGFHVDRSLSGNYYLRTNGNSPYAQG